MNKKQEPKLRKVLCRVNEDPNIFWAYKDDNNESFIPTTIFKCKPWFDMSEEIKTENITFKRWCTGHDL